MFDDAYEPQLCLESWSPDPVTTHTILSGRVMLENEVLVVVHVLDQLVDVGWRVIAAAEDASDAACQQANARKI